MELARASQPTPSDGLSGAYRRWMRQLSQLRQEANRLRSRPSPVPSDSTIGAALTLCDELLRELAGADLRAAHLSKQAGVQQASFNEFLRVMPIACLEVD